MKKTIIPFKLIALLLSFPTIVFAQKLPVKQEISVRAPADIKIDGKAKEWGDKFQAYNTNTDIFYTVSNDDENLYLIVQATKPRIIQKIIAVGITFTINNTGQKNTKVKENILINYPILNVQTGDRIILNAGIKTVNVKFTNRADTAKSNPFTTMSADSMIAVANKILSVNAKEIKIKGINEIPDTLISVYNEQHIRAVVAFDNKAVYTYELAVPLKYLGLSVSNSTKFSYNIKLRSRLEEFKKGMVVSYRYSKDSEEPIDINIDLDTPTDFWADYTLAKK